MEEAHASQEVRGGDHIITHDDGLVAYIHCEAIGVCSVDRKFGEGGVVTGTDGQA